MNLSPTTTRTSTEFAVSLINKVNAALDVEGVWMPPGDVQPLIAVFVAEAAAEANETLADFLAAGPDVDELARQSQVKVLLHVAEERPGCNPWAPPRNIPTPLAAQLMVLHALTISMNLAYANGQPEWAQRLGVGVKELADLMSHATLTGKPYSGDMTVLLQSGPSVMSGPILNLPQPGLALLARHLESVAARVTGHGWRLPVGDTSDRDAVAGNLVAQAGMLRDLTRRFGRDYTAGAWS